MSLTKCRDCGVEVDTDDPDCLCLETDDANRRIGMRILTGIRVTHKSPEWQDGILAELLGRAYMEQEIYAQIYLDAADTAYGNCTCCGQSFALALNESATKGKPVCPYCAGVK
jgi:hypothetical protein